MQFLERTDLQKLFDRLIELDYQLVGPRVADAAIVYDRITSVDDLPQGWTDEQAAGHYRLLPRDDEAVFGYSVGPHSWKKYLFPPLLDVQKSRNVSGQWTVEDVPVDAPKYAFIGVRACELAAIDVQDRTFIGQHYYDPVYAARREKAFIVAVNCTQSASTCFCTSMGTGPRCRQGFDLALTELPDGFLVEIGSEQGADVASALPLRAAAADESQRGEDARQRAVDQITRRMETDGIRDKLLSRLEHPRWDNVAERCLSCANCTLVCPTCFCHSVDEVSDLTSDEVIRRRRWDSCLNLDFSHVSVGPVRNKIR
ncbi:MAG: 4Fe-4S dicluster domain-containing protein [Aureliella sp.]